jgi:hypothetical protein
LKQPLGTPRIELDRRNIRYAAQSWGGFTFRAVSCFRIMSLRHASAKQLRFSRRFDIKKR